MENRPVHEQLIAFLEANPRSTKQAIAEGTGIKGLALFNALKKLAATGGVAADGGGDTATYSLTARPLSGTAEAGDEKDAGNEDTPRPKGRDTGKLVFGGQAYGKGPLVRAVVARFVADNPAADLQALKEAFPDSLLKRFGIVQELSVAKGLSGARDRYFFKEGQLIVLADGTVVAVCNQFTAANIAPFLKRAAQLGYTTA